MGAIQEYPRLLHPPRSSFFLLGVRGAGKSTWAREKFPDALRLDLLNASLYHDLLREPATFAGMVEGLPPRSWVILDEVQRLPGLLDEVHRFIEERELRFALLGSSARKLRSGGTNLLAGRAVSRTLFPLVPSELGEDFDLERVMRLGSIPVVWTADDPLGTLEAYVQLYLEEEIRAEALVRNLPGFARFLPVAALFHGQTINVASIARDVGAARSTIAGYVEILEDTLLAHRLPAFEARVRVRERKLPKLYWVDPGLVRAAKRQLGPVSIEETGPLFEGVVLTMLRAHREEHRIYEELAFWGPHQSRVEVDFLLRRGREFIAIEAKAASRFSRSHLQGLIAIADVPGVVRRILVYRGDRPLRTLEGIEVWPLSLLSEALAQDRLWP
jgi:predicted AAA+ superfamily ATPase